MVLLAKITYSSKHVIFLLSSMYSSWKRRQGILCTFYGVVIMKQQNFERFRVIFTASRGEVGECAMLSSARFKCKFTEPKCSSHYIRNLSHLHLVFICCCEGDLCNHWGVEGSKRDYQIGISANNFQKYAISLFFFFCLLAPNEFI